MVEVDDHVAGCFEEFAFFAACEDSARGDVVEVGCFVAAAFPVVSDGAYVLGVGFGVVADEVFVDVLRGCFSAGFCVFYWSAEEAHLGTWGKGGLWWLLLFLRFFFWEEWFPWLFDVEFFCQAGDEFFFGESFSSLVVVGCSEGDGVSVEELFVGVVVAGFVDRESLSWDRDSVYRDLDDATVCPDGVWAFSQVEPDTCIMWSGNSLRMRCWKMSIPLLVRDSRYSLVILDILSFEFFDVDVCKVVGYESIDFFVSEVVERDVAFLYHFDLNEWAVPEDLCEGVVRVVEH